MPRTRWLTPDQERAWRAYRRMHALLDLQIARDLGRDSSLSEADYDVLSALSEVPSRSWRASELAARLLWSTSRLAHHVGRMERRGLVRRTGSPDDRRGAVVALTDEGWSTLRRAAPAHVASVRRHFVELMTDEELRVLGDVATRVVDRLSPSTDGRPAVDA